MHSTLNKSFVQFPSQNSEGVCNNYANFPPSMHNFYHNSNFCQNMVTNMQHGHNILSLAQTLSSTNTFQTNLNAQSSSVLPISSNPSLVPPISSNPPPVSPVSSDLSFSNSNLQPCLSSTPTSITSQSHSFFDPFISSAISYSMGIEESTTQCQRCEANKVTIRDLRMEIASLKYQLEGIRTS